MYKYSKRVQERFFRVPCLSFLFLTFATSVDGKSFIYEKFGEKGQEYLERMSSEMEELRIDAMQLLRKAVKSDKVARELSNILSASTKQ